MSHSTADQLSVELYGRTSGTFSAVAAECPNLPVVGQWLMTAFSKRPHDVATARAFLIEAACRDLGDLPTYGEMAAEYGGIARGAGPVLNSIKRDCDQAGEPDLSALVVRVATGLPGTFKGKPVMSIHDAPWRDELQRICNRDWSKSEQYLRGKHARAAAR